MPRKTLYLIDGHAQIYRAYYAPFPSLNSPSGEPTRAVHVFMQMLLNLIRDKKPDYLAMTLDHSDATVFRMEIDPSYKQNRSPSPEDLGPQIKRIISILQAMKIPTLSLEGFEADDILATLSHRHAADDLDIFIVSRDKDLDQIITERVRLFDPMKNKVIDSAAMIEEKGYGPDLAVEAQMLIGDSTDNIKGVEGVGPKKAAQLLAKYGSVARIIESASELTPKLGENVRAFHPRMEQVRQLVTLRRDAPVDFVLDHADVTRFDPRGATGLMQELGLTRIIDLVGSLSLAAASAATAESSAIVEPASQMTATPNMTQGMLLDIETSATNYQLIDTEEALEKLAKKLAKAPAFAFDTETTDLGPASSEIVGISISFEDLSAYYIPLQGLGRTISPDIVRKHLGPIFANEKIRKRGQNIKFDIVVLKCIGIETAGIDFDSMIASFVLDSTRRSHGIDALAVDLLNVKKIATHELLGRGKDQISFQHLPIERTCEYACEDADVAWRLCTALEKRMVEPELTKLFNEVEMPLVPVLAQMEFNGVAVDTKLLARLGDEMATSLVALRDKIYEAAGRSFNLDSPKQLAEVLFDERKLRVVKKTKTGRSTDEEVLATLAAETDDPIPSLLVDYRELTKLKNTYVDSLPQKVCKRTGRIHPSFHQTGAVTGRLSCKEPNLQNIPIRTELGAQIRRAFVPCDTNHVLIKADYSQIELRVMAHLSGDKALAQAFAEDRDIHAFVASQITGVPLEQVTDEQRSRAKTVNFGIIYGQSAFGLAKQTGMSRTEAEEFIRGYFARYPQVRAWIDNCIEVARRQGYVKTMMGRRRTIADINSRNPTARNAAERFAVNTVVQGTAADLIKKAMVNIHHRILDEKHPSKMLLQVHDELVFECPSEAIAAEEKMIRHEMSTAMNLDVPIKVDIAHGPNWLDMDKDK